MIKKLFSAISTKAAAEARAEKYRQLIRQEAKIGGQLFGRVPDGIRREFFCLDQHTWVWHEEWTDAGGQPQMRTTRYDIRPNGILKTTGGQYKQVGLLEAERLLEAAKTYRSRIAYDVYGLVA